MNIHTIGNLDDLLNLPLSGIVIEGSREEIKKVLPLLHCDVDIVAAGAIDETNALQARVRELEAIVSGIERTADGVLFHHDMTVWKNPTNPHWKTGPSPYMAQVRIVGEFEVTNYPLSICYSTRAAAEAAAKKEGK